MINVDHHELKHSNDFLSKSNGLLEHGETFMSYNSSLKQENHLSDLWFIKHLYEYVPSLLGIGIYDLDA